MTKVYYGCDHVPAGWGRYFALCNALELDLTSFEFFPRKETLNKWRVESPKGFAFIPHVDPAVVRGLVAASQTGKTQISDELRKGWETTLEHAQALAAKALLLKTPLSFSPNPANRQLIETFARELLPQTKARLIWETEGMWSVQGTRDFAESLGMAYAIDPFLAQRDEIPPTHGDACFVFTERAGLRREFDVYDMEQVLDWGMNYDRIFALMRGRFQWTHARAMKEALGE